MTEPAEIPESTDIPEKPAAPEAPPADALAAAKKQAADNYDRYLRIAADLDNFRRRAQREKEEVRLFAVGELIGDLLPALDNLGLGLAAAKQPNADVKTLTAGLEPVLQQIKSALAGRGLKEIIPMGQPFDPHQHEAISHEPSDAPAEQVVRVVRSGFILNGRLLRPASVVVSSGPAPRG